MKVRSEKVVFLQRKPRFSLSLKLCQQVIREKTDTCSEWVCVADASDDPWHNRDDEINFCK